MNDMTNAKNLPGFCKSSFALPYNGGEIWFEHLDGLYGHEALALEKLAGDAPLFSRPSSPAYICFVLDETAVTAAVVDAGEMDAQIERTVAFLSALPPKDGVHGVHAPGENLAATRQRNLREGIPVTEETWQKITDAAKG